MKKFFLKLANQITSNFSLLLFNVKPLIIFELIFNFLTVSLITPLLFLLFRFAMNLTGYKLLTESNFGMFLMNPITIILIIALIFAIAIVALFDISAAIFVFECSRQKKKTKFLDIIKFSIKNALRIFAPKNFLIILTVLIIMPLLNIGVSSSFIGKLHMPSNLNFFIFNNNWALFVALIIFAIIIFLSSKWVFAIHYFTLERLDFIHAIKKSWHILRGNTINNFISILIVQIAIALLTKLLDICADFFFDIIAQTFGSQSLLGSLAISSSTIIFIIIYLILFAIFLPYSCLKISAQFYERKQASKETIVNIKYNPPIITTKRRKSRKIIFGSFIVLLILFFTFTMYFSQNSNLIDNTKNYVSKDIIANRGSQFNSTENTKKAIEICAKQGATSINVDIQISKDGIPFLYRDSQLKDFDISNTSFSEISKMEDKAITKEGYDTDNIISLSEAIQCAKNNNISLMLDISRITYRDDKLTIIIDTINRSQYQDKISIASNNYSDIEKLSPNFTTVYKLGSAIGDFDEFCAADTFALDLWCIDTSSITNIHNLDKKIIALDMESKELIQKAFSTKIDGILTSNVEEAVTQNNNRGLPEFLNRFIEFF